MTNRHDMLLYVGLGIISVGLVITVVGLGDKGYQTLELQVVGPGVVVCGSVMVGVRVLLCLLPRGEKEALEDCEKNEKGEKEMPYLCTNGILSAENQACDWSESQPHFLICEGSSGEGEIIRMNKNIKL